MNITIDPSVSPKASTAVWVDQLFWGGNCGRFQKFAYKIKAFCLSLQNIIKYIYLLYISLLFCFVLTVPFYPRKNERAGREKGKTDKMY